MRFTQPSPQSVAPDAQTEPQTPAVHVATALGPLVQGAQRVPQVAGSLSDTHAPLHVW
jgi:hypothetical protein